MKTRTNQPIYKDDGTLLTDEDLGGGGSSLHCYRINVQLFTTIACHFVYITNKELTDAQSFYNDLVEKGINNTNTLPLSALYYSQGLGGILEMNYENNNIRCKTFTSSGSGSSLLDLSKFTVVHLYDL